MHWCQKLGVLPYLRACLLFSLLYSSHNQSRDLGSAVSNQSGVWDKASAEM